MTNPSSNSPVTNANPAFPGQRRILFGHRSVGADLLRGIHYLSPATVVLDLESGGLDHGEYGIFHFDIGENGDPYSKIDDFATRILSSQADWDAVAMKLCYVDIHRRTDTREVFEHYVETIERISRHKPDLHIVHVTVPLRAVRIGVRSRLRLVAGRDVDSLEDNSRRDHYNSLLRATFPGKTQLFDLARIEATEPNGRSCERRYKNKSVPGLFPGFTHDGGHLNTAGARVVAGEFITFMEQSWTQRQ